MPVNAKFGIRGPDLNTNFVTTPISFNLSESSEFRINNFW